MSDDTLFWTSVGTRKVGVEQDVVGTRIVWVVRDAERPEVYGRNEDRATAEEMYEVSARLHGVELDALQGCAWCGGGDRMCERCASRGLGVRGVAGRR